MNGLWVRTQDGGLYFCIGFDAPHKKNYQKMIDVGKPFAIVGTVTDEMQPWLGWYSTEERAKAVMDRIQYHIDYYVADERPAPVYVMPKE